MRCSLLFGSLILLLLARAHGRLDMQLHAALGKKEMPSDLTWQRRPPPPPSSAGGRSADTVSRASERHQMITARAAAEDDEEVKKMRRAHRDREEVAQRLIHQDYTGPSGHSPNHHRTIRCGPC